MRRTYRIRDGSIHDRFLKSRKKITMFAGGFANGKTTALVIDALQIGQAYPGANCLLARSTYPKLNDTLRKVFIEWCPREWIRRMSLSRDNTIELKNGTTYNFRYIAQQSSATGDQSSNLLSATYDYVGIDQVEDPEIEYKDFLDLLGRLRGPTPYKGEDTSMPDSGPRWMRLTANPTTGWVYQKLVKPYHDWLRGKRNPDLVCEVNEEGAPVLIDGLPVPLIEVVEGSTYENRDNIPEDFIKTLEAAYTGQMRDRYLLGKWVGYEGLVFPQYDAFLHRVGHTQMMNYYARLCDEGYKPPILESYDHGLRNPSCYLIAYVDPRGNVCVFDGFYESEFAIEQAGPEIRTIRIHYGLSPTGIGSGEILADPAIFKRTTVGNARKVGQSVAALYDENFGIKMRKANNDIISGITKLAGHLNKHEYHVNPFTGGFNAPYFYHSDHLDFISNEFGTYRWRVRSDGSVEDKPVDRDDHAMDALRYLLTDRANLARLTERKLNKKPAWMTWNEVDSFTDSRRHRYGNRT